MHTDQTHANSRCWQWIRAFLFSEWTIRGWEWGWGRKRDREWRILSWQMCGTMVTAFYRPSHGPVSLLQHFINWEHGHHGTQHALPKPIVESWPTRLSGILMTLTLWKLFLEAQPLIPYSHFCCTLNPTLVYTRAWGEHWSTQVKLILITSKYKFPFISGKCLNEAHDLYKVFTGELHILTNTWQAQHYY